MKKPKPRPNPKELYRQQAARAHGNRQREEARATALRGLLAITALVFGLEFPHA